MQRPIEVTTWIGAGIAKVCEILADDPGVVFGDAATTHQHQPRRTVLGVDLRSGASVHQEVLVHLGVARTTGAGLVLPMAWEAREEDDCFRPSPEHWKHPTQTTAHGYGCTGHTPCRSASSAGSPTVSSAGASPVAR